MVGIIQDGEEVTTEEGKTLSEKLGVNFYEISIFDREMIQKIHFDLARGLLPSS